MFSSRLGSGEYICVVSVASNGKQFTALAILILVDKGKLSMEDDLVWEHLHETVQTLYEEEENLLNAHMNAIQVRNN